VWRAYAERELYMHCVFDQIPNLEKDLRQINTGRQVPLQVNLKKKHLRFEIRGHLIENSIFSPDPKSHTHVGSRRAENASEKFSRLGNGHL
jgi:hypothetical protein